MNEQIMLTVLRQMAWQRAKGELLSIIEAYYSDTDKEYEQFEKVAQKIETFIEEVEDEFIS